ncbi:MAG: class I SAM-dependent methyltransferase [Dehalococcoidales bacterium]
MKFIKKLLNPIRILLTKIVYSRMFHGLYLRMNEAGLTIPIVASREVCTDLWVGMTNDPSDTGNRPLDNINKNMTIMRFLCDFWSPLVKNDDAILELGCNAGGNLNYLFSSGYKHLSGVEISATAVEELKKTFPELAKNGKFDVTSIENWATNSKEKSVDVIFTMAVAMHVHPSSNFVFKKMAAAAKKYIITLEDENTACSYEFPRNFRRMFEKNGCLQLRSAKIPMGDSYGIDPAYKNFTARLFIPTK